MKKCKCGNELLRNLGYEKECHYCGREHIILEMSNKEIADELTRDIFYHKKDWALREAIRRILLGKEMWEKSEGLLEED